MARVESNTIELEGLRVGKSDRFLRFRCLDKRYSSISEPFPLQLFVPSVCPSVCVCVLLLRFPMARLSPASLQPSFVPRAPSQLSIRNITVMNNEHRSRAPPSLMTPSFPTGKNFNQIPTKKKNGSKKKTEDRRCGVADFCDVWLLLVQQQQQKKIPPHSDRNRSRVHCAALMSHRARAGQLRNLLVARGAKS